jgi:type VI secretion system protein ImpK
VIDQMYWLSADVLIVASDLASAPDLPSAEELRRRIMALLDRMVAAGRTAQVPDADIAEARYALVAFIDEQVLRSSWHGRTEWMSQPLQLLLFREYTAGENFFARMRALLQQGNRLAPLQVYYLCLTLGFRGAFGISGDAAALHSFAEAAQQQIMAGLPPAHKISPHAEPRDRRRAGKVSRTPLLALMGACFVVALLTYGALQWSLRSSIAEAVQTLPVRPASSAR